MPMNFQGSNPPNVGGPPSENCMDQVATHQRLLIGAALRTRGVILELGVGWYSTPLLHEVALTQQRKLITIDNNNDWLKQFNTLRHPLHEIILVGWWGEIWYNHHFMSDAHFGLVFCDQGQPIEREYAIRALIDKTDVFVMHDTEEGFAYGYNRTLQMFKYQWTDRANAAWTTVASNTVDVGDWFNQIPSVRPDKEEDRKT